MTEKQGQTVSRLRRLAQPGSGATVPESISALKRAAALVEKYGELKRPREVSRRLRLRRAGLMR